MSDIFAFTESHLSEPMVAYFTNASILSWVVKTTGRVNAVNLQQKNFLGHTVYKLVQTASQVLLSNFEVCLSQPTGSVPLSVNSLAPGVLTTVSN